MSGRSTGGKGGGGKPAPRGMAARRGKLVHLALPLAAISMLTLPASGGGSAYRLNAGDTVEISVAGPLEIRQRTAIQADGYVSVPMIGRVRLEGLTAEEMQTRIETAFASKPIRRTTAEGRERIIIVQPGDVAATIAEYRPIYVAGNVLKPMQYAFRPNMTAREAITLAGGVSLVSGLTPARYDPVEVKRDFKLASIEQAREEIHAARLEAELAGEPSLSFERGLDSPVSERTTNELVSAETEALKISLADFAREKGDIDRAVAQANEQVALLTSEEAEETEGWKAEMEERDRVGKLVARGTATMPRATDSRRALQLAASRKMRVKVELIRARQQREELGARQAKLESQRKLNILRDLAASKAKLAEIEARVEAAVDKLRLTRGLGVASGFGEPQRPDITIVRTAAKRAQRIPADEDAELLPGDTVEVSFRSDAVARLTREK